jgi:NAD(P)-dependent dehydrogenase (short-subunit alcohol dehydrogenase family)
MPEPMNRPRVLVTGAGTGIGREIALEFGRRGYDVALHYSQSSVGADSAVRQLETLGARARAFQGDLSDLGQLNKLAKDAGTFLGGIDSLVNNAGITFNRPFGEVTPEQFDRLYQVNVRAGFFLTQRVAEDMLRLGGGTVCNITSIHGLAGAPEHALYAGTKGAIIAQTRALAVELAHRGVRVNAIAPGWVTVENYAQSIPGFDPVQAEQEARRTLPLGRSGTPLDIARLAVFLCSKESEFVVGQTLVADGGTTALMSLFPDFRSPSSARFGTQYLTKA